MFYGGEARVRKQPDDVQDKLRKSNKVALT